MINSMHTCIQVNISLKSHGDKNLPFDNRE